MKIFLEHLIRTSPVPSTTKAARLSGWSSPSQYIGWYEVTHVTISWGGEKALKANTAHSWAIQHVCSFQMGRLAIPVPLPFCRKSSGTLQVHSEPDPGLVEVEIELFILLTSWSSPLVLITVPQHKQNWLHNWLHKCCGPKRAARAALGVTAEIYAHKIDCITIMTGEYETQYSRSFLPVS